MLLKKNCYICRTKIKEEDGDHRKYHYTGKYRGTAHRICNLKHSIPKEIAVLFHNGSNYDYHFITTKLAKEFEGKFSCLGGNKEKYITLSVPIKNRNWKNW